MAYKYRFLQAILETPPKGFRAVLITGPRRSGKSTFAQHIQKKWGGGSYVSFDTPLEQARFISDPVGFISSLKVPAVLDEVQNIPEVFNYLKSVIDLRPDAGCEYILTGSQQFQMMHRVSESLAGRILIKELLPFSWAETRQSESAPIRENIKKILERNPDIHTEHSSSRYLEKSSILDMLATGGFPPAVLSSSVTERAEWFNSYLETYVQRDVRALSNVQNLTNFSRFVNLVAGRTAQVINYSELGKDIGVNYKTAQHYLSLLESSYLWRSLPPFYKLDSEKRLSKSPKGIFTDTGLAMFLTGAHAEGLDRNPLFGALFESLVIIELSKLFTAFGERVSLCHFRVGNSAEVDLVIEYGNAVIPIEIKGSASIDSSWGKGIKVLREVAKLPRQQVSFVISLSPQVIQLAPGIWNIPLTAIM
jgi:uncharacterized protein